MSKRECVPVLPQRRTDKVQGKLKAVRLKALDDSGVYVGMGDPSNLPEELRRFDRELFLKYNLYAQGFEVWLRPGGKEIEDNRHQSNDQFIMSCGGLSSAEIKMGLWERSDKNPANRSTEDELEDMAATYRKEAVCGTPDKRTERRYNIEKYMVDIGIHGRKFLKGGQPSNRLI